MQYQNIHKGIFLSRPNRFIAHVALEVPAQSAAPTASPEGEPTAVVCHVKNTGRCKELLVTGATVYLEQCDNPARKTKYDLVAVEKAAGDAAGASPRPTLINMDAQAPNKVFGEWLAAGGALGIPRPALVKPEVTFGKSRFDFYWEAGQRRGFVEVKGVTLEEDGLALFPDAPTERGVKHLNELIECQKQGYEACIFFVIQMTGIHSFSPNDRTHPAFGEALRRAAASGVTVLAYGCAVTPDTLALDAPISVVL